MAVVAHGDLRRTFFAILGTYVSLRFKSSARAIATTIAVLVFVNGGYLFCCMPLIDGPDVILVLAGCTPMIVTSAPFSARELDLFFSVSYSGSLEFRAGRSRWGSSASDSMHPRRSRCGTSACSNSSVLVDRPTRPLPPYPGYADLRGIRFVEDRTLDPRTIGRDEDEPSVLQTHFDAALNEATASEKASSSPRILADSRD